MSVCTFFGHRDCPPALKPKLRKVLIELIEHQSIEMFYVGNKGAFDRLVRSVLRELAQEYPQIRYAVVLERLPGKQNSNSTEVYSDTILPEGMEEGLPHFAIVRRNKWMLHQSSYVITYITHSQGGAAQFAQMAERAKKTVINLADISL